MFEGVQYVYDPTADLFVKTAIISALDNNCFTDNNLLPLFLKNYKIKDKNNTQYLIHIINNIYLSDDEKIKILDKYDDKDLNNKLRNGEGLICSIIHNNNKLMCSFFLND